VSDSPSFPVSFDEEAFAEDLAHASAAGRAVGERERRRLEREGIAPNELRAHPGAPWQLSVYEVAHRRMHAPRAGS
jgi:hypothetical protein